MHAKGEFFRSLTRLLLERVECPRWIRIVALLEEFVATVVVDEAIDWSAVAKQAKRYAALGHADGIVVCSIDWIEQPAKLRPKGYRVRCFGRFLGEEVVVGKGFCKGMKSSLEMFSSTSVTRVPSFFHLLGEAEIGPEVFHLRKHGRMSGENSILEGGFGLG